MLKAIGVDYAQGYGMGKPEPLENLADTPSLSNCAQPDDWQELARNREMTD
jgi:EAL domain-containing protein (putative c-di-GMP-specific phosphodiesterase class I)